MKVYRVEHIETKEGPFHYKSYSDVKIYERLDGYINGVDHPAPTQSMISNRDLYYGCRTINDLKKWFPSDMIEILASEGFHVCEFKVKSCSKHPYSDTQIALKKKNAVVINCYPISILFE